MLVAGVSVSSHELVSVVSVSGHELVVGVSVSSHKLVASVSGHAIQYWCNTYCCNAILVQYITGVLHTSPVPYILVQYNTGRTNTGAIHYWCNTFNSGAIQCRHDTILVKYFSCTIIRVGLKY